MLFCINYNYCLPILISACSLVSNSFGSCWTYLDTIIQIYSPFCQEVSSTWNGLLNISSFIFKHNLISISPNHPKSGTNICKNIIFLSITCFIFFKGGYQPLLDRWNSIRTKVPCQQYVLQGLPGCDLFGGNQNTHTHTHIFNLSYKARRHILIVIKKREKIMRMILKLIQEKETTKTRQCTSNSLEEFPLTYNVTIYKTILMHYLN